MKSVYDPPQLESSAAAQLTILYRRVEDADHPDGIDDWFVHVISTAQRTTTHCSDPQEALTRARDSMRELLGLERGDAESIAHQIIVDLAGEWHLHSARRPFVRFADADYNFFAMKYDRYFSKMELDCIPMTSLPQATEDAPPPREEPEDDNLHWQDWLQERGFEE